MNDSIYYYSLTRSRLGWRLGYHSDSKEYARIALNLSGVIDPQFPRHKTVGVVKSKKQDIIELEKILNE